MKKSEIWQRSNIGKLIFYGLAAIAVIALVLILGHKAEAHINAFETWISSLGPMALVAFVLVYILLCSLMVPDTLLGIMAGATLGFTHGAVIAICGSLLGTVLQYTLSRHLLKPVIDKALTSRPMLKNIQSAVLQQELKLQILLRLTPLNRAMTSYMLGAAGVGFSRFMLANLAIVPTICLEVYFGYASKHLAKSASKSEHSVLVHDGAMLIGILLAVTVTVLVSRMAHKAIDEAATASASSENQSPTI